MLAIEDDHFGDVAEERADRCWPTHEWEDRVIDIRSFSKSIAPDLRLSVAACRHRLRTLLEKPRSR